MHITIEEQGATGFIDVDHKVIGRGAVNQLSWCLTSTSTALIFEISDDPSIQPIDLPLVGFAASGWLLEFPLSFEKIVLENLIKEAFLQFHNNKLTYVPAVSCPCSDL